MYIPQSCTVRIPVRLATFVWEHLRTKFGYFPNFFKYFRNRSKKTLLFVVSVPLRCFGCNFTFWTQKRFNCFLNKEKVAFTQSKRSTTASINHFSKERWMPNLRQQNSSPAAWAGLTKQIYKQLLASSRRFTSVCTSEFTSAFKCSHKCSFWLIVILTVILFQI
jgi:hypothetical protein